MIKLQCFDRMIINKLRTIGCIIRKAIFKICVKVWLLLNWVVIILSDSGSYIWSDASTPASCNTSYGNTLLHPATRATATHFCILQHELRQHTSASCNTSYGNTLLHPATRSIVATKNDENENIVLCCLRE